MIRRGNGSAIDCRGKVGNPALHIGVARGHRRSAIALEIHGPDVVAACREGIQDRIVSGARHRKIEARERRNRRTVDQEQHRQGGAARRRVPLAVEGQRHGAFAGPVFGRPGAAGSRRRGRRHRPSGGGEGRRRPGSETGKKVASIEAGASARRFWHVGSPVIEGCRRAGQSCSRTCLRTGHDRLGAFLRRKPVAAIGICC